MLRLRQICLVAQDLKQVEDELRSAQSMWDGSHSRLPVEPDVEDLVRNSARNIFAPVLERGMSPVAVICSSDIVPAVNEFLAHQFDNSEWYRVVALEELGSTAKVESVGVLSIDRI